MCNMNKKEPFFRQEVYFFSKKITNKTIKMWHLQSNFISVATLGQLDDHKGGAECMSGS